MICFICFRYGERRISVAYCAEEIIFIIMLTFFLKVLSSWFLKFRLQIQESVWPWFWSAVQFTLVKRSAYGWRKAWSFIKLLSFNGSL